MSVALTESSHPAISSSGGGGERPGIALEFAPEAEPQGVPSAESIVSGAEAVAVASAGSRTACGSSGAAGSGIRVGDWSAKRDVVNSKVWRKSLKEGLR